MKIDGSLLLSSINPDDGTVINEKCSELLGVSHTTSYIRVAVMMK